MILVQILLNASMNGFRRKIFDLWKKNGANKYCRDCDISYSRTDNRLRP